MKPVSRRSRYLLHSAGWVSLLFAFFLPLSTSISDISFLLTAVLVLFSGVVWTQRAVLYQHPAARGFFILTLLMFLGALYAAVPPGVLTSYFIKMSRLWVILLIIPLFFEPIWQRRFLWVFVGSICLELLCIYLQHFHWIHIRVDDGLHPIGIFKDYIAESLFFSFVLCVCLYQVVRGKRPFVRLGFAVLGVLILVEGVFISSSRVGLVMLPFLLIYSCLFFKRRLLTYTVLGLMVVGALMVFVLPSHMHTRVKQVEAQLSGSHLKLKQSIGFRVLIAQRSWILIKQRPWLGYGTGAIRTAFERYNAAHPQALQVVSDDSNNTYLNFLMQYGVVGLVVYLAILVMLWVQARHLPDEYRYYLRAILLMLLVGSVFNSWLKDTSPGHFFLIFISLLYGRFTKQGMSGCHDDFKIE